MRKSLLLVLWLGWAATAAAQQPTATTYRATERKVNDLVHTKLDLRFDYAKRYAYGKEWLTLKPHATATDSLRLDAKGMDIKAVALLQGAGQQPLKFDYDQRQLLVHLGRMIPANQPYTVYIEYTAKPDELGARGSAAIRGAKGLYFITRPHVFLRRGEKPVEHEVQTVFAIGEASGWLESNIRKKTCWLY